MLVLNNQQRYWPTGSIVVIPLMTTHYDNNTSLVTRWESSEPEKRLSKRLYFLSASISVTGGASSLLLVV
jgi:hypothetical protein